ncbi:MAG: protein translocase subunit SecD [Blastochloris sp.]|nr:protein translocase subunit SecD [Blastochloris sp.]
MNVLILILCLAFLGCFVWYLATITERHRLWAALGLIAIAVAVCSISLFVFDKSKKRPGDWPVNIKQGLDLSGGTQFTLQLAGSPSSAALDQAVGVIRKRIDSGGVSEPIIQPAGDNRILVQVPGINESNKSDYRQKLERVAKLEFRMVHPESESLLAQVANGKAEIPFEYEVLIQNDRQKDGTITQSSLLVKKRAAMSGKYVKSAWRSIDEFGRPEVVIDFDSEGKDIFGKLTTDSVGQRMAIVLDGLVYSSPSIRQPITTGNCQISGGNMTPQEAEELASVLENPLETPVSIVDERGVDPSLGAASVKSGFKAALIGFGLVVIFMIVYYRRAGVISVIALGLNMFILLGLLAQFGFTLTLPGVAALILTIGMAVDANVLIFERIREELDLGKPLRAAIESGFAKAFSSILDANVTTLIATVILFWQGSGAIQGFAVVLTLGVLASLFSALIATRAGFDLTLSKTSTSKLTMMRLLNKTNFDFMRIRFIALTISAVLILGSIAGWMQKGERAYGVDFVGGDLVSLSFTQKIPDDQLRAAIGISNTIVQYQKDFSTGTEILAIRTPSDQGEKAQEALAQAFPQAEFKRLQLDKVQAVIGGEFKNKAILALGLGMLGIFAYIMTRFEFSFAIGAIVALIHDVVISIGLFIILGQELSLVTVGAILTLAGYSINDTIIIFDRIRETLKHDQNTPLSQVINTAVNATLSRTLLTSGTTLLAVLALYYFGGLAIHDFTLMLLIGIAVGTYSSIFVASPIVLLFGERTRRSVKESVAATVV